MTFGFALKTASACNNILIHRSRRCDHNE